MKRVLIFSLAYYPKHVGGAEVAIKEITDRISHEEFEFHMITNRYDSTLPRVEKVGNVLVHRIGISKSNPTIKDLRKWPLHLNKIIFQFSALFKAMLLHRKYSYSGIWAMMAHSCGVPASMFKTLFPKTTYILTLQEGDPPEYIKKKMAQFGPLFKRAFTKADVVQAISTFLARWAEEMKAHGEVHVIPNAVDVRHFSQAFSETELRTVRKSLSESERDVLLVTTSRLVHKNGIDDVIRALSHLPEHVRFIVYGTGPDEQKLIELAKSEGVYDRVLFKGHIDHADMPLCLKACDVFIRPSRSEGMGNSFIEAMAAELPVIATQEGGIADFLFDASKNPDQKTTGWAVEKNNPTQIAGAVEDILNNSEKVYRVLSNAKELVTQKYDWDLVTKDMKKRVFSGIT